MKNNLTVWRYFGTKRNNQELRVGSFDPSSSSGQAELRMGGSMRPDFVVQGVSVARKSKLILVGSGKPRMRKAAVRDWSKAKERTFLSALADTCNVSEACRVSGVPMTVAYRRRKTDAAFRAGWLEAIGVAYQRLELVLLDRAFNGTEKVVSGQGGYRMGDDLACAGRSIRTDRA